MASPRVPSVGPEVVRIVRALRDARRASSAPWPGLVSAIAGRTESADRNLAILAVGDDDQNVYAWSGAERLAEIETVKVLAVIERHAEDSEEPYRSRYGCERWEIPLVEIVYRAGRAEL